MSAIVLPSILLTVFTTQVSCQTEAPTTIPPPTVNETAISGITGIPSETVKELVKLFIPLPVNETLQEEINQEAEGLCNRPGGQTMIMTNTNSDTGYSSCWRHEHGGAKESCLLQFVSSTYSHGQRRKDSSFVY